jgi:hypothetical protein
MTQGCNNIVMSWLYRTCWNNLLTSLIISRRFLQVVNSLFQTCWQLGTSSANTTCWRLVGRLATRCEIFTRVTKVSVFQFRTVAVGSSSSSATTSVSETPSTSSTANPSRSKFAANAIAQARAAAQMGHTTDPQMGSSMDHYSTAEVFINIADLCFQYMRLATVISIDGLETRWKYNITH